MNALLLLMGGSGLRFGGSRPKQFVSVASESGAIPLFELTARKLIAALSFDIVVLVAPQEYLTDPVFIAGTQQLEKLVAAGAVKTAAGGATRAASFHHGLAALAAWPQIENIAVHDANRPYLSPDYLMRCRAGLQALSATMPALIPTTPVVDSIVQAQGNHLEKYVDRNLLQRVQTPQLLHLPTVQQALQRGKPTNLMDFTDEGMLCLALGLPVQLFEGDADNVKITYPNDLSI